MSVAALAPAAATAGRPAGRSAAAAKVRAPFDSAESDCKLEIESGWKKYFLVRVPKLCFGGATLMPLSLARAVRERRRCPIQSFNLSLAERM